MSGGHWNYENDQLCREIFGWSVDPNYGKDGFGQYKKARKINPMEDKQLSELLFDFFCLLHSYDWYRSGDCCRETYEEDVKYFKGKWLGKTTEEIALREIELTMEEAKRELLESFGIAGERKKKYGDHIKEMIG